MPPQRKCGGKILRDGFCVFTRIAGLAFHSDFWTLVLSFSKGPGLWFFGLWTFWFYKGYDLVFRIFGLFTLVLHSDTVRFFWTLDWFFYSDFGLSYNVFSFACIKIEILSAFISFHRLLFNQLLGKLICI